MSLAELVAAVGLVSLVFYALLAGADFGGGLWDMLAPPTRRQAHRELVSRALAPVWEANHVWLILLVVLLFTGFPQAFAALTTALHVPLTLMLLGIVARGTAFTFRHYDTAKDEVQRRRGLLFAYASVVTPVLLGITLGAATSGSIRVNDWVPVTGFFAPWLEPFPFAVGFLTLALFAFLAAVYLTNETQDPALRKDFRLRALASQGAVVLVALVTAHVAGEGTRGFQERLLHSWWSAPLLGCTVLSVVGAVAALLARRYRLARVLAAAEVALVVVGWALAQRPYLLAPDITIEQAAAPERTLLLLLVALGIGSVTLFPSLYWLFRVFKRQPAFRALGTRPAPEETGRGPE